MRLLVVALAAAFIVVGVRTAGEIPIDVLPEFAPPVVEIQTEVPGRSRRRSAATSSSRTATNRSSSASTPRRRRREPALVPLVVVGNLPGHEIEYPMAFVILGGLASSTLLNLFVVPAIYARWGLRTAPTDAESAPV